MKSAKILRLPRALTPKEKRILAKLSRNKFYDFNHPEEGVRYRILRRVFIPADHDGHPQVVLLCAISAPDKRGFFGWIIFADGLHGKGHWPSDKHGAGTMEQALASFEEHIVRELLGHQLWVVKEVLENAKSLARAV